MDAPPAIVTMENTSLESAHFKPTREIAMLPQLPKDEDRPVCHGCGQAKFLPYSIRTGEPATAKAHGYCSIACAQRHSPGFTGKDLRQ
jgi:hypothetical protein